MAAAAAAEMLGLRAAGDWLASTRDVLLVDMASYRPPDELRMVLHELRSVGRQWKLYGPETERLATKVLEKSGLSPNATYLPPAVHPCHTREPDNAHGSAHPEAEMAMIGAVRELLDKTATQPRDVDVLITCASIWCATPSQAAMLVNHFGMREDVQAYHLGGMGCATGVLLMALIRDILQARPNSRLLFVASETTSYAFYPGMEVSRRVSNVIFRMGGTAVLFSNRRADRGRAKYRLAHHVRFHTSADDAAYRCISWSPDAEGHVGVYLGKDVVDQAGAALTLALTAISPRIMGWGQLAQAATALLHAKLCKAAGWPAGPRFQPDYSRCVDHFLIHAGGYAVLKGIQAGMRLPAAAMLPSFAALRDYGNTSASTTWYSFSYLESLVGVSRGQRIMQIGCGGGMKVAIAIWECLRDVSENHRAWRHLTSALTEDDLPRSIGEATKLTQALKQQQPAADVPAAAPAAAAADVPAAAAVVLPATEQALAAAAAAAAKSKAAGRGDPLLLAQATATGSPSAAEDTSPRSSSTSSSSSSSSMVEVPSAAAGEAGSGSATPPSAASESGDEAAPEAGGAGEAVVVVAGGGRSVAQFDEDPEDYEFHL